MKMLDLTGERFGRLVVEGEAERRRSPNGTLNRYWHCLCECGSAVAVSQGNLRGGHAHSCGCLQRDRLVPMSRTPEARERSAANGRSNRTHGMKGTPTYNSWKAMIYRCTNPRADNFERYGGRGIAVCQRWRESFAAFYADMGERPDGTSLDRYPDPAGNYEPGNCRWATRSEQDHNKRQEFAQRNPGGSLPAAANPGPEPDGQPSAPAETSSPRGAPSAAPGPTTGD